MEMSRSSVHPAFVISSMASRSRAISCVNDAFVAMTTVLASIALAAMRAPSMTSYGLRRRMVRSLRVPGSPSAALTTTIVARTSEANSATLRHLRPVGKPAPPRPRSPDASISSMIASRSTARAFSSPCPPPAFSYSSRER